jgi:hypothetical protein
MNAVLESPRDAVEEAAAYLLSMPQSKGNVRHLFYPGIYVRELSVAAGNAIVGRVYKAAQVNILAKGVVLLRREDGSWARTVAPQIFLGGATRKIAYVIKDMVWMNVFATDERDVETLEASYLEDDSPSNERPMIAHDGAFEAMCAQIGYTPEQVREASERSDDLIPFPIGEYKVKIGRSRIEGRGLIATSDIAGAEIICHACLAGKRTPAGRYMNHSDTPNAQMFIAAGNVYLRALRAISGCVGGQDGEEVTVDYRFAVELGRNLHHE